MTEMKQLLAERARTMAAHDGAAAVGAAHLHGAANQLQAELLAARDGLIASPPPAPAAEPAPASAPTPRRGAPRSRSAPQ